MAVSRYYRWWGFAFGMCFSTQSTAQILHIDENQRVRITENTLVVLGGGLNNQGSLANFGNVRVFDDWVNPGTFQTDASGVVEFADISPQRIDQRGQSFHHLVISGGGAKNLLSAALVTGTLTLNEGVIAVRPNAPLTLEATASVAEGSAASYVERTMQYRGKGLRSFPLGLNGEYLPLTLQAVAGESPTVQVSVLAPLPTTTTDPSLERVSSAHYWRIIPTGGTFGGSVVELPITAADGLDDLLGAVVAQSPQVEGEFTSVGQSVSTGDATEGTIMSEQAVTQAIVAVGLTSEFSVDNKVLVPSAFAPDAADPVDRTVKIFTATLLPEPFSFRIFDRWGILVYQTASLSQARDQGWDGRRQSDQSLAPPGVYQYHLRGLFESNVPVNQTGTITLFH